MGEGREGGVMGMDACEGDGRGEESGGIIGG